MGRGQKICPECDTITGPRSYKCPQCQYVFIKGERKTPEVKREILTFTSGGQGKKQCPECDVYIGVRNKVCPQCNHTFEKKIKSIQTHSEHGRGKKKCDKCGAICGCRTKTCPMCQALFHFTPSCLKENKENNTDWKELKKGDLIRVVQQSGPYWPFINELGVDDKIPMGYHGKFKVMEVTADFIRGIPASKNGESGNCIIWMGEPIKSPIGMMRLPHKVYKLKTPARPK